MYQYGIIEYCSGRIEAIDKYDQVHSFWYIKDGLWGATTVEVSKKIEDKDYQNSEKIRDSSIFRENLGDKNYRNSENDKGCL